MCPWDDICFSLWFWLSCAFYNRSLKKHIILLSKCTSRLANKGIHIKLVSSVKGSQLGAFYPAIVYYSVLLPWIQTFWVAILRTWNSFQFKELFEPIVLRRKGDGVLLFLKVFSWETDLWVTLVDFTDGKKKNTHTKKQKTKQNKTKCGVRKIITIICVTYTKVFLDSNFNHIFTKLPQITHSQKSV